MFEYQQLPWFRPQFIDPEFSRVVTSQHRWNAGEGCFAFAFTMTLLRLQLPPAVILLCLLAGCETAEPKKQSSVPGQAKAPQVTYSEDPHPKQPVKQAAQPQEAPKPKPAAPDAAETLIAQTEKLY